MRSFFGSFRRGHSSFRRPHQADTEVRGVHTSTETDGAVRAIPPGRYRCDQCGFSATTSAEFPIVNCEFTCPKCGVDESGLDFGYPKKLLQLVCPEHGVRWERPFDKSIAFNPDEPCFHLDFEEEEDEFHFRFCDQQLSHHVVSVSS
jgi:hypothetical protein